MIRHTFIALLLTTATIAGATAQTSAGGPQLSDAERSAIRANCRTDISTYCPGLRPGDPNLRSCIVEKMPKFNEACRTTLGKAGIKEK